MHLKEQDPDRFLLSLFIKSTEIRQDICVVDSLNYEIARLKDVIDTPHMGFIRLQWWRDEISNIYQKKPFSPHPVLQGISDILLRTSIPQDLFEKMLGAREADFDEHDVFDIYDYAYKTHVPMMAIKALIIGEEGDAALLAEGYALIGLLRSIPFYKAQLKIQMDDISPNAVKEICDEAERLLSLDETKNRYFKAHRVLAQLYINQLRKNEFCLETLKPLPFKELRVWFGSL